MDARIVAVAKRLVAGVSPPRDLEAEVGELRARGVEVADDLATFCGMIGDGTRLDFAALGGSRNQALHDLSGLMDANDPQDGSFGILIQDGEIAMGLVMFGYGANQLVYDSRGVLGPMGAIWQCENSFIADGKQLAPSLLALLESAKPCRGA